MTQRIRKLVGGISIVVFLIAYAGLAITLVEHLPAFWLVRLSYFTLVGTAWGAPLIPLITWMNSGRSN